MVHSMAIASARAAKSGSAAVRAFDGVKVFSATMVAQRETLGDVVTNWIEAHRDQIEIIDVVVTQSSDAAFHCIAISVFYRGTI